MWPFLLLAAGQSAAQLYGANQQANAIKDQANYNAAGLEMNARIADFQADDAVVRGEKAQFAAAAKTRNLIGSQRAAMGASGISLDSGTALDIQNDTRTMGERDALTIKNNAWREAWGYRTSAFDMRTKASMTRNAAENDASNTLLTGGLQAINSGAMGYAKYNGGKA